MANETYNIIISWENDYKMLYNIIHNPANVVQNGGSICAGLNVTSRQCLHQESGLKTWLRDHCQIYEHLWLGGASPGRALRQSPERAAGQPAAVQPARSSQRRLPDRCVQHGRSAPSVLLLWAPAGMAAPQHLNHETRCLQLQHFCIRADTDGLRAVQARPGGVWPDLEARKCCWLVEQQW